MVRMLVWVVMRAGRDGYWSGFGEEKEEPVDAGCPYVPTATFLALSPGGVVWRISAGRREEGREGQTAAKGCAPGR